MDEIVESWENEDAKKWGRAIIESIRNRHGEAGLKDPVVILETAVATFLMMEKEMKLQVSGVIGNMDQLQALLRDQR